MSYSTCLIYTVLPMLHPCEQLKRLEAGGAVFKTRNFLMSLRTALDETKHLKYLPSTVALWGLLAGAVLSVCTTSAARLPSESIMMFAL